jgi:hypothetical protein
LIKDAQIAARLALRDISRQFYDGNDAPVSFCCCYTLVDIIGMGSVVLNESSRVHRFYDAR